MEFRFNISKIFKNNISRIGNSLLPAGYIAQDRRAALDATAYVAEIINTIGQASATAQGLNHPITTADRLRSAEDQVIYLMTEDNDKNGVVVGLLKIGRKSLYVFDKHGQTRHVNAPCVLDFYIHESRQRGGMGKILFDHMLEYENLCPEQLAIDRPSEKLLAFLKKHYSLSQKIPQMNNFVIYDGFFGAEPFQKKANGTAQMQITASPNSNLFGPQFVSDDNARQRSRSRSRPELPIMQNHVLGRYGAPRPPCSLNQIIHNKPTSVTAEPNRIQLNENFSKQNHSTPLKTADVNMNHHSSTPVDELVHEIQTLDVKVDVPEHSLSPVPSSEHVRFAEDHVDGHIADVSNETRHYQQYYNHSSHQSQQDFFNNSERSVSPFQYNKRQTGKKNISSIVVGNDDKMEFDQIDDRGFGVVKINRPIGLSTSRTHEHLYDNESINSRDSEHTHTADGFFDLKFYSHPLW